MDYNLRDVGCELRSAAKNVSRVATNLRSSALSTVVVFSAFVNSLSPAARADDSALKSRTTPEVATRRNKNS